MSWTDYNEWGEITHNTVVNLGVRQIDVIQNYTGHDYDPVLDIYYAKARFYDAGDRRFTQIDPIKGLIIEPMTMTPYVYVVDNPLKYVDPLGMWRETYENVLNYSSSDSYYDRYYDLGNSDVKRKMAWLSYKMNTLKYKKDVNVQVISDIIEEYGLTGFTLDIFYDLLSSGTKGTISIEEESHIKHTGFLWHKENKIIDLAKKDVNYLLSKNYSFDIGNLSTYSSVANYYTLMVEGEITLVMVSRPKTQANFYDLSKSGMFSEEYNERTREEIYNVYVPAFPTDENELNDSKELVSEEYKYYDNIADDTAFYFWYGLDSDSEVMAVLAGGLDTENGIEDNTGIAKNFGEVYKSVNNYPEKDDAFVLGEIYGHANGLKDDSSGLFAGKNKARYWIADVENPNVVSTKRLTRFKQNQQNDLWEMWSNDRQGN